MSHCFPVICLWYTKNESWSFLFNNFSHHIFFGLVSYMWFELVYLYVAPKFVCTWILQEVLNLYARELPTMNYAANTGKQSMFLERCVSNGYRMLLLPIFLLQAYTSFKIHCPYLLITIWTMLILAPILLIICLLKALWRWRTS